MSCADAGRRLVAVVLSVFGTCAIARAQSALEGSNPGANAIAWASAVEPDGTILDSGGVAPDNVTLTINEATAPAQITSPIPGSTLTSSTVQFRWTAGSGVSQFWLFLGTTVGGNELYNQTAGTSLSATISGLPTYRSAVYVRLWSLIGGTWQFVDYVYSAGTLTQLAELITPAPGATLTASTVEIQWTGGIGVSQYWLSVGTTIGGSDLINQDEGTNLSATAPGLPTTGGTLHVRLWSRIAGAWQFHDYRVTATTTAPQQADLTSPAPGSTLSASTVQFRWTGGTGVSQYWLSVGTTIGGDDLLNQDQGTSLSATVTDLPAAGSTLFVRLWSRLDATWQFTDHAYTATTNPNQVAQMTSPAPASTLSVTTVAFQWTGGTGSEYRLSVGTTPGGTQVFDEDRGTSLDGTVSGLPATGSPLYARLWSRIGVEWQFTDTTYTAVGAGTSTQLAEVTSPAPGSTLTAAAIQVRWTGGTGVSQYWLSVGTTGGGSDLFSRDEGTNLSATVAGLPTAGSPLYLRLWSRVAGAWQFHDYQYTSTTSTIQLAELTSPAPGSRLRASTVAFQWTGGTGVSQYWLSVGTTAGGADLFSQDQGTNLSATVPGLPTAGSPLHVRLYSLIGGTWQFRDSRLTATTTTTQLAELTSPAPESTLTAATVQFQWTGGTGVLQYWLMVGTTPGGSELFNQDRGTNLTATVPSLPMDRRTLYVRLWSRGGAGWQFHDYTYVAGNGIP